jgi:hypothetical protein
MTSVGMVYATPARDGAVFLTAADIAALQESIAVFRLRPTVAGPPLGAAAFDPLSASLNRADQADAQPQRTVVLTSEEQRHLELLMAQAAVRASLPLRIRRSCTACGSQRIVNPARPKPRKAGSDQVGSIVSSVQLLSEGHPILAGLTFLANATGDRGAAEDAPVCERCEGVDFSDVPVTFCPGCHELRAEAILLTCPDCAHDFTGAGESTSAGIWTSPRSAADAFALAHNVAVLREESPKFENGLYPDQLTRLTEALGASDELICMCRCGLPTEIGRYVALLITSDQLVWSRQSMLSGATGGAVAWREIADIRDLPGTPNTRGVEIVGVDGNVLKFNDFRGAGVTFGAHAVAFTPDGIRERATLLAAPHRPAGSAGVATRPAPLAQPTPPPAPVAAPPPVPVAAPPVPVGTVFAAEPPTAFMAAAPTAPPPSPGPPPPAVPPAPPPTPAAPPAQPPPQQPLAAPPQPPAVAPQQPHPQAVTASPAAPAGWYADPWRIARLRWWDGARWSGHVAA